MTHNSILRQRAREQLGGNIFANQWLMVLLVYLIYSAIVGIGGGVPVVALVVSGPLVYGLSRICIKRAKEMGEVKVEDLFCGFSDCFGQSFILSLLIGVFTALWSLLFVIPGIVKSYAYSMAFYILQDDPTKDWRRCLDESQEMMKGYKWKLFCLDFSFIGWYFLGSLCFGIGMLFVAPYHHMARANFYLDIKGEPEVKSEFSFGFDA